MERSGLITLTTDFGQEDVYRAILYGVIWDIFPQARIVDLTHQVRPQAILEAAFLLESAYRYFPQGTVHLAVVDPGVGTTRALVAVETPWAFFVAPDNGLLTVVWDGLAPVERAAARIIELTEPHYWRPEVSSTFHGRDILAPVAAHLAAGVPLEHLGRPRREIVLCPGARPLLREDGTLVGQIVHVDRFGNCISNIPMSQVEALGEASLEIEVAGCHLSGLARTYADGRPGQPLALAGSDGRLEIAVRDGSAAAQLELNIGTPVCVRRRL